MMAIRIVESVPSTRTPVLAPPLSLLLLLLLAFGATATAQSRPPDRPAPRWPDRTFHAVRVWIQPASTIADWTPMCVTAARDAFLSWNALDLGVPFSFVADSASAEVRVHWVDRFDQRISGHTRSERDSSGWMTGARMELAVHHHTGRLLDEPSVRAMALHEVGHVLGLEHSSDESTVMSPTVRVRELTAADGAAARRLYGWPHDAPAARRRIR